MLQDAHKTALARLCANVTERHTKGLALLAEANAAPDMGTVKAKLAEAMPLLSDTSTSLDAIVQTATVMATGEMPVQSPVTTAETDPAPAAPSPSAETAAAAPASASDAPNSTQVTGDVATDDGSSKRKR
jgi:hypothetical protein